MIAQFYTPRPKAMVFEKSRDGQTFTPLQYYADDCQSYFGLANDGPLTTTTDVNCVTTDSKQRPSSQGQVAFRLLDPSRPQVVNYDQLPTLRELAYSSSVRLRMVDYFTSQTLPGHLYYGIIGLRVLGRCECNGHATECAADESQGVWVCTCQHNTAGRQVQNVVVSAFVNCLFMSCIVCSAQSVKRCTMTNHGVAVLHPKRMPVFSASVMNMRPAVITTAPWILSQMTRHSVEEACVTTVHTTQLASIVINASIISIVQSVEDSMQQMYVSHVTATPLV